MSKGLSFRATRKWTNDEIYTDEYVLVELLKECTKKKDLCTGAKLHAGILEKQLHRKNPFVASTLINMYAKCGVLDKAHQVLDDLPVRDIVSWSALITGYAQNGKCSQALQSFDSMLSEGLSPNSVTFISVMKACADMGAIDKGKQIHKEILKRGLLSDNIVLGTALIHMYAKCGLLDKAQHVLCDLPVRDVASWNALIAGYVHDGQGHEALLCFEQMLNDGITPDMVTFSCVLKACGNEEEIGKGQRIHDEIVSKGLLENNIVLGNALVDMYVKCGSVEKAQQVFYQLPARDMISWNSLVAGYVQFGQAKHAFNCFEAMKKEGLSPDVFTLTSILKACSYSRSIDIGKQIHDQVVTMGLLDENVFLGTALVDMYAKCGVLEKAQEVLDLLPARNVVSWSALIAGYVEQGRGHEAVCCFERMKGDGFSPDVVSFICVLKACSSIRAVDKGKQIHDEIVEKGLLRDNIVLGNALVDMYSKCDLLGKAREVLDQIPIRDIVSWNSLIAGYSQNGKLEEAFTCLKQMQREGVSPDAITFVSILKVCGSNGALDKGKQIHDEIINRGLLNQNIALGNSLVDMYAKCGMLEKAQAVHDELPIRDAVSLNALIAGYAQEGQGHDALICFERMKTEGLKPDAITFVSILKACANIGAIERGEEIHDEVLNSGLLDKDAVLGTALVDMYAKCGMLRKAQKVLNELPVRNVACWNALISGYAQQGQGREALHCLQQMQSGGLTPDSITILCVLNACSHSGLVKEAEACYEEMITKHGIKQSLEHHTCMVDVLGSAGHFDKAMAVIKNNLCSDYPPVWLSILSASRKWGNVKLGKLAFDHAIQLDENYGVYYILMADIYASVGMLEDAEKIEAMRLEKVVLKNPRNTMLCSICKN